MTGIVFDLDGTLVDSAPDIRAAVNTVMAAEGAPALDLPTVISFIGNGLPRLVELVIAHLALDPADQTRLTAAVLAEYNRAPATLSRLYPHAEATLRALRQSGHAMALCTNKPEAPARAILAAFGVDGLFDAVIGGDTLRQRKPDPAPLMAAAGALGTGPVLYVGDSEVDAQTASAAALPFALFTEGYRKTPADQLPHTARFADFRDLPGITARLLAPARA